VKLKWSDMNDDQKWWTSLYISEVVAEEYREYADLSGIVELLKAGVVDQWLFETAAAELHQLSVKRSGVVERRKEQLAKEWNIYFRTTSLFGDPSKSKSQIVREIVEEYGFSTERWVYRILKKFDPSV
jgi:hypothetical protein